jgi:copper chaperone CopZ
LRAVAVSDTPSNSRAIYDSGCASNVTKKIQGIAGVVPESVKVDLKGKEAQFQAQDANAATAASELLTKAGFPSKRI